jgi:putative hydrolase of the HAD superfamily
MTNLDAVLFDLDDTLLDRRASFRAFADGFISERFTDGNLPDNRETMIALMEELDRGGYGKKSALYETVVEKWNLRNETAEELTAAHYQAFARHVTPDPDMAEVLDALAPRYRLGLITNGSSEGQHAKLDRLGIRTRFSAVVVSGDVGIHKPDPRIFEMCLSALGVAPARAVYVGDHYENDVLGARGAGMRAIWYPNDPKNADVPAVARLRDVLNLL